VIDDEGKPLGEITLDRLKTVFEEQDLDEQLVVAADVMLTPVREVVTLNDTLDVVMSHLSRLDVAMLPVVNSGGKLAGCITRHDMMVFFEYEILKDKNIGLKFIPENQPEQAGFIEVPEGHLVEQIEVTEFLNGRTLRQLDLRATAGLNVMGIHQNTPEGIRRMSPDPGRKMALGEVLIVMGEQKNLESFKKAIAG
jgi:hypothetical protein